MSDLSILQHKFQHYLLSAEDAIFNEIVSTEAVPTELRLSIYGQAYRSRLTEALATNFPALEEYLGHEQFAECCDRYIDLYPSHFKSIRWFGDRLATFLKDSEPYSDYPYLSELALVEWTDTLVFDAPDDTCFTLEKLAEIPPSAWPDMSLHLHPSVYVVALKWNVVPVWQAMMQALPPPDCVEGAEPVSWIFWRQKMMNYFYPLAPDEACAMAAVLRGSSFSEICDALCLWVEEEKVALRAASLLKVWIGQGILSAIQY